MKWACALDGIPDPLCSPVAKAGSPLGTTKLSQEQLVPSCFLPPGLAVRGKRGRGDCEKSSRLGNQWLRRWVVSGQTVSSVKHKAGNAEGFQ